MNTFLRLGFISGVLAAFLYWLRGKGRISISIDVSGPSTFVFEPNVNAGVTIVAPEQDGRPVRVEALPVPQEMKPVNLERKGMKSLIASVIEPKVTDAKTGEPLTKFDPPLTITVSYANLDLGGANPEDIFLGTFYFDDKSGEWRGEPLLTHRDLEAKTLTADISNLRPSDPVGVWN